MLSGELADGLRTHRVRVVDDADAGDQRQPERSGEAERMEERQRAHHDVGLIMVKPEVVRGGDPRAASRREPWRRLTQQASESPERSIDVAKDNEFQIQNSKFLIVQRTLRPAHQCVFQPARCRFLR